MFVRNCFATLVTSTSEFRDRGMKGIITYLLVFFVIGKNYAQIRIRGVVQDMEGEALIAATVLEKGTNNGTNTDFDGIFELELSSDSSRL